MRRWPFNLLFSLAVLGGTAMMAFPYLLSPTTVAGLAVVLTFALAHVQAPRRSADPYSNPHEHVMVPDHDDLHALALRCSVGGCGHKVATHEWETANDLLGQPVTRFCKALGCERVVYLQEGEAPDPSDPTAQPVNPYRTPEGASRLNQMENSLADWRLIPRTYPEAVRQRRGR